MYSHMLPVSQYPILYTQMSIKVLCETHPANSAAVTVELLFVLVIIQLTLVTKILQNGMFRL